MDFFALHRPALSEEEVALLLRPQNTPARPQPKRRLYPFLILNKDDIFAEIIHQRQAFKIARIAELHIQTLAEAEIAGEFFASLFPDPSRAKLGIMELIVNAIEHGNLEITSEEKVQLMKEDRWQEEITYRSTLPQYANRYVHIKCYHHHICTEIVIEDDGRGFNWTPHINISNQTLTALTGRGIACAYNVSFDEMRFMDKGNVVKARQYLV